MTDEQMVFPTSSDGEWKHGMTLLDWFAGQAMAGILASSRNRAGEEDSTADEAYMQADEMMKTRKGYS